MDRPFHPRRALLLAVLLVPLAAFAQKLDGANGEWVGLGRNENFRAYLDQRSVQRNGDLVRLAPGAQSPTLERFVAAVKRLSMPG